MEWEWEWVGMGIGMIRWKWEGNGNKTAIPAHLYTKIACWVILILAIARPVLTDSADVVIMPYLTEENDEQRHPGCKLHLAAQE